MKITRRLLIPTVIFVAVVITVLLSVQTWVETQRLIRDQEEGLRALSNSFDSRIQADTNLAVALAMEVANNASVQAAFAARDRDALTALTLPSYQELETRFDIPQYQFHLPPATSFLRLHQLDRFGDDLSSFRQTVLLANANREIVAGLEVGRGGIGLRGVVPVYHQGQHIGSVEFGSNLDEAVLQSLKENFNADWQITLRQDVADVAVTGFVSEEPGPIPGLLLQTSTLDDPVFGPDSVYTQALAGESVFTSNVSQGGRSYSLLTTPLLDFSGAVIGTVDVLTDRTALAQLQLLRGLMFVGAMVLSLGLVSYGVSQIMGRVLRPVGELTETAKAIAAGDRSQLVEIDSPDELGALAEAFNKMTNELNALIGTLETRVAARTRDLVASAEVSRSLSTILDPDQLAREVVQQVRDAFDYYHVQIYLLDEAGAELRLISGTGQAGRSMVVGGHRLALGQGLVGQAAAMKTAVLVPDVTQEPRWLPNPLLPETMAETAVPILIGQQLLGVLDVQHNIAQGLTDETVSLLQSIANQVAIALQNGRQLAEIQANRQRLDLVVSSANDGIWDWEISSNKAYFSPRWKIILGYEDHEIPNDQAVFSDLLHPDDRERTLQAMADYLAGKSANYEQEFRMQHKDGSYRWIIARASLVRDKAGNPLRIAGSHTDITERKQAEARILDEQTLLRTIIDSSPDWITVKDPEHRFRLVNRAFATSFGLDPEYMLGKDDLEIGFPEEVVLGNPEEGIRGFWADDDEVLASGEVKVVPEEEGVVQGESLMLSTIKVPLRNAQGDITGLVAFVKNITDLKRAEDAIRQEQARTQAILESVTTPLLITRLDGSLVFANEWAANMVGLTLDKLEQFTTGDFYAEPASRREVIHMLQTQGSVSNYELLLRRFNQETFWGLISSRIFNFQGEPAIVSSIIDISKRREVELSLAARARELQTVALVSTTAATILNPAEMLQEVVDLTRKQFDLYHTHIFLLDEAGTTLELDTGAGETGRQMVAEGRRIPLSQEQSLVARAARTGQGVVINDVQAEPGFLPNPLLPLTRAEMAVPLVVGAQILGVLDVQATEVGRFSQEEVSIFTTLATQVAVALQNARRYEQAQRALDELTRIQRVLVHEGWQAFLLAHERPFYGFHFDQKTLRPMVQTGETAVSQPELTLPLAIRGETIGQLGVRNPSGAPLSASQRQLLTSLTNQVSEALERARLSEQTQIALSEAETLSQLGAQLNAAQSYSAITAAVASIISARTNPSLRVTLFQVTTSPQGGPGSLLMVANSSGGKTSAQYQHIALYELNERPAWTDGNLILIDKVATDPRLNQAERESYQQRGAQSLALLPLRLGTNWVGLFSLTWAEPVMFTEVDARLFSAMIDQLAVATNSLQLLATAQQNARQQQLLREVSTRVSAAVDAESVLKTATREIGRALGLETFIYLKSPNKQTADSPAETQQDTRQPADSEPRSVEV
jgi:PAS domain S-box-containing protein